MTYVSDSSIKEINCLPLENILVSLNLKKVSLTPIQEKMYQKEQEFSKSLTNTDLGKYFLNSNTQKEFYLNLLTQEQKIRTLLRNIDICEKKGHDEQSQSITPSGVYATCKRCNSGYFRAPSFEETQDFAENARKHTTI